MQSEPVRLLPKIHLMKISRDVDRLTHEEDHCIVVQDSNKNL